MSSGRPHSASSAAHRASSASRGAKLTHSLTAHSTNDWNPNNNSSSNKLNLSPYMQSLNASPPARVRPSSARHAISSSLGRTAPITSMTSVPVTAPAVGSSVIRNSSPPRSAQFSPPPLHQNTSGAGDRAKLAHLLADMESICQQALEGPNLLAAFDEPAPRPHSHSTHSIAPTTANNAVAGRSTSRPASATVRGHSAERTVRPAGTITQSVVPRDMYMSRKGKSQLDRLAQLGRAGPPGRFGGQTHQQSHQAEEKESDASHATSQTPYYAGWSARELSKELACVLETLALHEAATRDRDSMHRAQLEEVRTEALKWQRLAEVYKSAIGVTVPVPSPAVTFTQPSHTVSKNDGVVPRTGPQVSLPSEADEDEYEDDTEPAKPVKSATSTVNHTEATPSQPRVPFNLSPSAKAGRSPNLRITPTTSPSSAVVAANAAFQRQQEEDNAANAADAAAHQTSQKSTATVSTPKTEEDDYSDDNADETSEPAVVEKSTAPKVSTAFTFPTPPTSVSIKNDDPSDEEDEVDVAVSPKRMDDMEEDFDSSGYFEERAVAPIVPKPAPSVGSLKGSSTSNSKHVKKSSVTFADDAEFDKPSTDSPSTAAQHVPTPYPRGGDTPPAASTSERASPRKSADISSSTITSAPSSDRAAKQAALEAEKQRRSAEIDSMFPSDEEDDQTIVRNGKELPNASKSKPAVSRTGDEEEEDDIVISDDDVPYAPRGGSHSSSAARSAPISHSKKPAYDDDDDTLAASIDRQQRLSAITSTAAVRKPIPAVSRSIDVDPSPPSSGRTLAPSRAHHKLNLGDVSAGGDPSHTQHSPSARAGMTASSVAGLNKMIRPGSATRDGSRNSSRPSSASSRESSRPSSATRTRPAPFGGPSAAPLGPLRPVGSGSNSFGSSISGRPPLPPVAALTAAALESIGAPTSSPFVVRDEDEYEDDAGSELYGEEDIEEEASFNVQTA
jgi:hypothetical protein